MRSLLIRAAGTLGSAFLLFASMPPLDLSGLAFLAFAPLYAAAYGRGGGDPAAGAPDPLPVRARARRGLRAGFRSRSFLTAYCSGAVFYVLHLHWLLNLSKEEVTIPWIMIPALAVMALYLGLYWGVPFGLAAWIARRTGISPAWTVPVLWTLFDYLRTVGETGFSWGSPGYALAPWTSAIQIVAWTGYWVLPAWILLASGLVWRAFAERGSGPGSLRSRVLRLAAPLALVAIPVLAGRAIVARAEESVWVVAPDAAPSAAPADASGSHPAEGGPVDHAPADSAGSPSPARGGLPPPPLAPSGPPAGAVRFGLVQANTPREIKWNPDYRGLVVGDLVDKSLQIASAHAPAVIVWPETAAPLRVLWERDLRERVEAGARASRRWTLVGTLDAEKIDGVWEHYNSAILFRPDGTVADRYHKRRMVPFGELTPYREFLPALAQLDFGQSEFTRGPRPGLFPIPGVGTLSCLICFESTFPELARKDVAAGADFLVNITNDFWFGPSAGPLQHARFAVLRAVETRTPLVRCANSGITFVVDPYGRVHGATELFTTALRSYDVLPGKGGSVHARTGDWFLVALLLAALGCLAGALRPLRGGDRRRSPGKRGDDANRNR